MLPFAEYEQALCWRGQEFAINSLEAEPTPGGPLPARLVAYVQQSQYHAIRAHAIDAECAPEIAAELTASFWKRAQELEREGRLPCELPADLARFTGHRTPRQIASVIGAVVAAGLVSDERSGPRAKRARSSKLAMLGHAVRTIWDLRGASLLRNVRRAVSGRESRATCIGFADAATTLFYALKQVTGALSRVVVVELTGEAFAALDDQHAWNWVIDLDRGDIAMFDVSNRASSRPLDARRYRNVSGFLATAAHRTRAPYAVHPELVADLMSALIDPESDRGLVLLFHIADHIASALSLRERIAVHLAARDFDRLVPGWRARLDHRTASLGRFGRAVFGASGQTALAPLARLTLAEP